MRQSLVWVILLVFVLAGGTSLAQELSPQEGNGVVAGGMGYARIGDEDFISFTIRPEIAIGKIGIGLSLDLLYNVEKQEVRAEDWDESYDYFRILRYIRYGHKKDPVYARIGAFDRARIGHGFLMNYYTNEDANYDKRKIGLALDLDFGKFGFESITSNLGRLEIVGGRVYTRPVQYFSDLPIVKNLAFGASYITDVDPDEFSDTDDAVSAFGLDSELPLINNALIYTGLYYDYGKIVDYGSGQAFGIEAELKGIAGLFNFFTKFERRLLGDKFLPTFFGPYYEVDRYNRNGFAVPDSNGVMALDTTVTHKAQLLGYQKESKGWYGELGGHVLGALQIVGTYQWLDDVKHSGLLHVQAEIPDAVPKIAFHATYDKDGIETVKDLTVVNSVARVGIGYKINPWMLLNMEYIYTFYEDDNGAIKSQKRIRPGISFVYNFPVGN
ncbi:hypothetical protein JXJ21_18075 [candidate division KSB1 bacterium]|nr:hypothetical protein [candidate division KSB1 bacterium]